MIPHGVHGPELEEPCESYGPYEADELYEPHETPEPYEHHEPYEPIGAL